MATQQQRVVPSTATVPPAKARRADRDVQDVLTGDPDKGGEVASAAPLQPSPVAHVYASCWFQRTWHRLFTAHLLNSPDEIVAFSHSSSNVRVRLSNGAEYCMMKESF